MARGLIWRWKWELIGAVSSLLFVIVIVILLLIYNGKPIWDGRGLTLNAVVSILATASKASLMFAVGEAIAQWKWVLFGRTSRPLLDLEKVDAASRGPLGSAKLVWPRGSFSLLRVGAVVTILALALDPFAQQLVQFEQHLRNTTDTGTTIPWTLRYSKGSRTTLFGAPPLPGVTTNVDFAMESAILYGLVKSYGTVAQQIEFNCPSGNCTWDPFESLGMCATCNDLSNQVISYPAGNSLYINLFGDLAPAFSYSLNGTAFQLPNGLLINNENGPLGRQEYGSVYMTTYGTGNTSKTVSFKENENLVWAVSVLRVRDATNAIWPSVTMEASECGIYYCVKRYQSQVRNGTLDEIETQADIPRDAQSWQPIKYGNLSYNGIDLTPEQVQSLEFNNITSSPSRTDLRFGDQFNVSQEAIESISSYLQDNLKVQNDLPANATLRQNRTTNSSLVTLNGWYVDDLYSPRIMQVLYETDDLNQTFNSLAKSMSNAMRADADGLTVQTGVSQSLTTYYHIVWPWITLHAILVFTAIIFLLITMRQSSYDGIPSWKSNSLAPLSRYTEIGNVLVGAESIEVMEQKASRHMVRFFWDTAYSRISGDNMELVTSSSSPRQQQPKSTRMSNTRLILGLPSS